MKRRFVLGAAVLVAGMSAASVVAASDVTRNFTVSSFDHIVVAGSTDVTVTTGKAISIRATGDAAAVDRLEITVDHDVLRVGTKRWSGNWSRGKVHVYVTVPILRGADVAGSANVAIDRVETTDFGIRITGSGDVKVANLKAKTASFDITGSGDVEATGIAQSVAVKVAGSGDAHLGGLKAANLTASVKGSGNVDAFATGAATISVAGSGDVRVRGGAYCKTSKAGSGTIDCG